ncbi:hypothetical protein EON76_04975 [bacterium]|nr:MAG: hypothetical protein EON76_04975 [bacterium]
MNEKIGELLQFDETMQSHTGRLADHPVFLRAKAIQDVLNDSVTSYTDLLMGLTDVCNRLNYEVKQTNLYEEPVTFTGASTSVVVPETSVDYADGSIAIEADTTSTYDDVGDYADEDEEEDEEYRDTLDWTIDEDDIQPSLRSITAPFAGFGFTIAASDTRDKFEDIDHDDLPCHGEIYIRQALGSAATALADVTYYTAAKIEDVSVEFDKDKTEDTLKAATEKIEKFTNDPAVNATFIDLVMAFADDELNSENGFRAIAKHTKTLLNEPTLQYNPQFTDAIMDYVMHITELSRAVSIATSLIIYPPNSAGEDYRPLVSPDDRPMLVESGFGELITLQAQQPDEDKPQYQLFIPCSVEGNRVGYIPLENIVKIYNY